MNSEASDIVRKALHKAVVEDLKEAADLMKKAAEASSLQQHNRMSRLLGKAVAKIVAASDKVDKNVLQDAFAYLKKQDEKEG
jgi:hypothetical protein